MQYELNLVILDKTPSNLSFAEGKSNPIVVENMSFINQLFEKYPQDLKAVDQSGQTVEPYEERAIKESKSKINFEKILEEHNDTEKILLLSDFQKSVIDENLAFFQDSTKAYVFMPPYLLPPNNVMVDSIWVEQSNGRGENTDLRIRLFAIGNVEEVNLALESNGQLIGTQLVEMAENASIILDFPIKRVLNSSYRTFQISLEGDQIEFDNEFYFSVLNQDRLKVLGLSAGSPNEMINTVFENEELFEFRSESLNNFSFQDLDEYDLVLLHLGDELNNFAASAIKTYASSGNSLLIIPESNFDQFNFLEELGFANVSSINQTSREAVRLEKPDIRNPFFKNIFNSMEGGLSMPESQLFMKWNSGQNLLAFANSYPFLGLTGRQENVFAFSVPLNEDYTNFTRHGIFLPVLYKISFSGKRENQIQYAYLDDAIINLTIPDLTSGDIFKLRQGEQELVPDQRISGNKLRLILHQEDINNGFYDVVKAKTEVEVAKLSLNYPKSESQSDYYTSSELQTLFQDRSNIILLDSYDFSSIDDYIAETKKGFPLWKYFLVLALLSLLAEVLIIRFFK
ncbi:hypothetical protein [Marivirga sericea]|nr:hypothetical protein [Marivirga sericea]